METEIKRRTVLLSITAGIVVAAGGLAIFGLAGQEVRAATVLVYKDPNCGCCGQWIAHLRAAGFTVDERDTADMARIKSRAGVPDDLQSCHTAITDGYIVEGHVPAADIKRMLSERPKALGLAVPGMPMGSPGMEHGTMRTPYNVILFQDNGTGKIFARY